MWDFIKWIGVVICIGWPIYEFRRMMHENDKKRDEIRQWTEDDL